MTFSIDPARRSPPVRRTTAQSEEHRDDTDGSADVSASNLPVPVSPARTVPPEARMASAAAIEAQILGERRGLRAGAAAIQQAQVSYARTEWSGSMDRRAPKGGTARTEI